MASSADGSSATESSSAEWLATLRLCREQLGCSANAEDDAFLGELLITFFGEALAHCLNIQSSCMLVRSSRAREPPLALDRAIAVVSDEAHAIKGSAASAGLAEISKSAKEVEGLARSVLARCSAAGAWDYERSEAVALCVSPALEIRALVGELRKLAVWQQRDMHMLLSDPTTLTPEARVTLAAVSLDVFDAKLRELL